MPSPPLAASPAQPQAAVADCQTEPLAIVAASPAQPLAAVAGSQSESAVSVDAGAPPPPPPPPPLPPPRPASKLAACCCCRRREPCSRARVARALDSHTVHLIILLVIVVDVALLLCEILLSNVCPAAPAGDAAAAATLAGWELGLSWASRALVIALLLHQAALCAAEGPCAYVRQPLHVADAAILVAALVLELVLAAGDEAGLIAVLLGWRLLRVLHGLAATLEAEHADAGDAREEARALQKQVDALTEQLAEARRGGGRAEAAGGHEETPPRALPAAETSAVGRGGPAAVA